jgi:hypothetical protein
VYVLNQPSVATRFDGSLIGDASKHGVRQTDWGLLRHIMRYTMPLSTAYEMARAGYYVQCETGYPHATLIVNSSFRTI